MSEISRKQSPPTAVPMSRVTAVGNHDPVRDGHASAGSALGRVVDPDDTFPPSLETTLRSAFSLTTAECRVVKGLLDGLSPREIAGRLDITPAAAEARIDRGRAMLGEALLAARSGGLRPLSRVL